MSLMGIKDISSLNTPPLGRQAIHTQIIRYDPERIRQAIRQELNRDGQVYFVHNRVYNIERVLKIYPRLYQKQGSLRYTARWTKTHGT